jgi:hypothetical protein
MYRAKSPKFLKSAAEARRHRPQRCRHHNATTTTICIIIIIIIIIITRRSGQPTRITSLPAH